MLKKRIKTYYLMAIPALVLFFMFHTYPSLQGLFYSFTNWKGYGTFDFVGIRNYIHVFKDSRAIDAYLFTFKFSIFSALLVNIISLMTAMALNSKIPLRRFFRALFFLPYILSILIIGFIFRYIFTHFIPEIARALNIALLSKSVLGQTDIAWLGIVFVAIWQSVAFNTLLYLTGMQTIPEELYEISSIDGANSIKKFFYITLPLLMPFVTINAVLSMKNFLMVFDHIMALTEGGPGRATESIAILIYRGGFLGTEFAYQSANAVVYFIIILIISMVQMKFFRKMEVNI